MKFRMWLILVLGLCGCASFERQFADDLVRSASRPLNRCEAEGFGYDGINQALERPQILKILMIHGVGTHHPGYSRLLQENLAARTGLNIRSRQPKNVFLRDPQYPQTPLGNLQVTYWESADGRRRMLFYELTWSVITAPYKKILAFDTTEQYSEFRVPFNNMMKEFLDNALPDPMIYLKDPKDLIVSSSKQALCWVLKTDWNDIPDNQTRVCAMPAAAEAHALAEQNIMFVTHSLGSQILMDTIVDFADRISDSGGEKAALQNKELTLFMMANQLPILLIDRPLPRVHNRFDAYCLKGGSDYRRRIFKSVNIVAFSDPNDILSYAIPQPFADKYIDSRLCPMVTNVSVNVAPEISAFGVGIVNPVEAHTFYDRNPKVIDLMTFGTDEFKTQTETEQQCRFIRLKNDKKM